MYKYNWFQPHTVQTYSTSKSDAKCKRVLFIPLTSSCWFCLHKKSIFNVFLTEYIGLDQWGLQAIISTLKFKVCNIRESTSWYKWVSPNLMIIIDTACKMLWLFLLRSWYDDMDLLFGVIIKELCNSTMTSVVFTIWLGEGLIPSKMSLIVTPESLSTYKIDMFNFLPVLIHIF